MERKATWETKESMRRKYPELFQQQVSFEDETSLKGGGMKNPKNQT